MSHRQRTPASRLPAPAPSPPPHLGAIVHLVCNFPPVIKGLARLILRSRTRVGMMSDALPFRTGGVPEGKTDPRLRSRRSPFAYLCLDHEQLCVVKIKGAGHGQQPKQDPYPPHRVQSDVPPPISDRLIVFKSKMKLLAQTRSLKCACDGLARASYIWLGHTVPEFLVMSGICGSVPRVSMLTEHANFRTDRRQPRCSPGQGAPNEQTLDCMPFRSVARPSMTRNA